MVEEKERWWNGRWQFSENFPPSQHRNRILIHCTTMCVCAYQRLFCCVDWLIVFNNVNVPRHKTLSLYSNFLRLSRNECESKFHGNESLHKDIIILIDYFSRLTLQSFQHNNHFALLSLSSSRWRCCCLSFKLRTRVRFRIILLVESSVIEKRSDTWIWNWVNIIFQQREVQRFT